MNFFEEFRNADGTYNGINMLSKLSGLDVREIEWTAMRLKQLIHEEGKAKEVAKLIVKTEAKDKPWLK